MRNVKRKLTYDDVDSFFKAAEKERKPELPPLTVRGLQAFFQKENPVRWWRMQRDLRWMKKKMVKKGYRAEDARWLL